jgi:hypothetical protein
MAKVTKEQQKKAETEETRKYCDETKHERTSKNQRQDREKVKKKQQ